jgi:glycerol-3-phosphate cytidylyltransferase-like family protein
MVQQKDVRRRGNSAGTTGILHSVHPKSLRSSDTIGETYDIVASLMDSNMRKYNSHNTW